MRAVLGHELSHVYKRDILISSVAGALATMVTYLAYLAGFFGGGDDDEGPGFLGALLMMILGPVAAAMIQMAISRAREYQADESGARLTRDPIGLASALRKIDAGTRQLPLPETGRLSSTSHLMIANPFRGGGHREALLHPPTDRRPDRTAGGHGRLPPLIRARGRRVIPQGEGKGKILLENGAPATRRGQPHDKR
ncbi:M48 family metalloprotease [Nonomuraea angiospora]|uniref:M48 family metalloprotease n=1 Tax=Nonomuraea angiospora TaxID=46172 RepID=UPI0033D466D1